MDGARIACITSFDCKIGGKQRLKCVGKNPRLAQAKSKNDKNISGLLNQIEAGKMGIHTFTNASAYTVAETNVRIISIEFAAKEETHVQFFGQVLVDVSAEPVGRSATARGSIVVPFPASGDGDAGTASGSVGSGDGDAAGDTAEAGADGAGSDAAEAGTGTDGSGETGTDEGSVMVDVELPVTWTEDGKAVAHVTYEFNDSEVLVHYPAETWGSGKHILSLYYPIDGLVPNITNTFNVHLRMEGGTAQIGTGGCIASISGQGMAAGAAWDGTITVEEYVRPFALMGGLQAKAFSGEMGFETMELVKKYYSDSIRRAAVGAFGMPVELPQEGEGTG